MFYKYLYCFIFNFVTFISLLQGQSVDSEFDIDSIFQKHRSDTLVCLTIRSVRQVPFSDSTFENPGSDVQWRKILLQINNGTIGKKLYSYAAIKRWSTNYKILQSKSILDNTPTLLRFIRQNLDSLKNDGILPFIAYKPAEYGRSERYFYLPGSSHGTFYSIQILWNDGNEDLFLSSQFSEFELSSEFDLTGYKNLNYNFNQTSYFKQLFDLIRTNQKIDF